MPTIKGQLMPFFETGSEGTYFTLYDEKFDDPKAEYRSYEGVKFLKNKDFLGIYVGDYKVWEGNILFINALEAKKHKYFKMYVKKHSYEQLCFAGLWVHYLPTNIDLGLWHDIFFYSENPRYTGIITYEDRSI
jgi:hypothetical protein